MTDVHISFKAHLGWVAVAIVRCDAPSPTALATQRLELFTDQSKEILEPYHVAGGWDGLSRVPPPRNPAAVIAKAQQKQADITVRILRAQREAFKSAGWRLRGATILTGRGRSGLDLDATLRSHAQIHIAEGELVRVTLRKALGAMRIPWQDQDEKSATERAAHALKVPTDHLEQRLKSDRPPKGNAWTKEHRDLTVAGWLSTRN